MLASGSRQVWELLESDTARGEKKKGRRGAGRATNPRGRWRRPRGAQRRRRESQEVDAAAVAAEARCGGIRILEGEAAAAIAIDVDDELKSRGSRGERSRGGRERGREEPVNIRIEDVD